MKEEKLYRILEGRIDSLKRRDKSIEDRKTYDAVFDRNTLHVLYKMFTSEVLDALDYPISTGKEGNVFRAKDVEGELMAVKIYRTSTSTFRNLAKYIAGDPRFRRVPRDRHELIYLWAQKEFKNLSRMFNAGIPVPRPKKLIKNVLVMDYIGSEQQPAPMLKDIQVADPRETFEIVLEMTRDLYQDAKLVHGDLSEYNILVEGGDHFFIDVGQSVVLEHPMAVELLERDVFNMCRYFGKLGVRCDESCVMEHIIN